MYLFRNLILLFVAASAVFADQVTLKNGDTITGSIIKKDKNTLTLKSEFLGEVSMPWSAITAVKSDNPLYVVLPGGAQVNGKLGTEGNTLTVQTPAKEQTAPIGQVDAIRDQAEQQKYERLLHPGLLELWAGYVDLGLSLARGNARTDTLTTAFSAVRATNSSKTNVFFNQIYSTALINAVNGTTANAARGGVSYDHNLSPRLFLNFQATGEYDQFQNLDYRFTGGGGLGFHAIKSDRTLLDLLIGGDYSRESFSDGLIRNLGEVNGGDDLSFKVSGVTALTQSFRIFDAPVSGEYRVNFDIGTATTIKKWLSWQVTASDRFLSAPIFGRKRNDVLLTTGFRVAFAR